MLLRLRNEDHHLCRPCTMEVSTERGSHSLHWLPWQLRLKLASSWAPQAVAVRTGQLRTCWVQYSRMLHAKQAMTGSLTHRLSLRLCQRERRSLLRQACLQRHPSGSIMWSSAMYVCACCVQLCSCSVYQPAYLLAEQWQVAGCRA